MTALYSDKVGGTVKSGFHCDDWTTARRFVSQVVAKFPPKSFGTNWRFKPVSDGVELHVQRFAKA
jgi:hypothetical protein